ncbi:MAG: COR domain-containing protein [Pyrinomonadaceae bacterium]
MSEESGSLGEQESDGWATALSRIELAGSEQNTKLDLSGLGLSELPEQLAQLTHLYTLDLKNNKLTTLPEWFFDLTNLAVLNLSGNQLSSLPDSVGRLSQLSWLYLSRNELSELPEAVGSLTKLTHLFAWKNRLETLPDNLNHLSQLEIIEVSDSPLSALPDTLGQLRNLRELKAGNTGLESLPDWVGDLTELEVIEAYGNKLTELPEALRKLAKLRKLNLANNRLTDLPPWLRGLPSLEVLYLHNNDLGIPVEVLGPRWFEGREKKADAASVLEYYFPVRGGRRPLNEAKLILLGRGTVGKTSLVNRLVHGRFEPGEKKTEGIQITEWPLRLNGNEEVRLNVWDFGGQEIMHATHQFFLTERSLYLLVLNGREGGEDADADYWLRLVESFGGDSPVIVVLNKIKEHPFDVVRRALQQKYPFIRDFIKTDCADGTGIEEVRRAVVRETDRLEHLRDAFPAAWFSIKERLAGMKKNYLSFEEYRRFCEQQGEQDAKAQEALAGYLHNLGIVLNYREDPRLQDKHVLNPHWVTGGIYKILNSEKLERQKGEIRLNELSEILDPADYPADMRRFILDLMKRFELCFSFPDDDARYLVPELLDKQEPPDTAEFDPRECLNFQYHYPVLPEGLLPRFIVRTRALSEGLARWRSGVILEFEGDRALVKGDVQDKKVLVSVSGPRAGRRRLLAVIRSDFERIHRDIRNLNPQEIVPLPGKPEALVPYEKLLAFERSGIGKFHEFAAGEAVELDVQELLNGVDIDGARRRARGFDERARAVRVFISYSHRDEPFRKELETHLKILQQRGLIDVWSDRDIDAGDDWRQRIDDNLERADIVLLLVSADFNASDYCREREMRRALEREQSGEALVVPVIVRDANLSGAPYARLQYLPEGGRAVDLWENKDSAWRSVSEGIETVAKRIRAKSGPMS